MGNVKTLRSVEFSSATSSQEGAQFLLGKRGGILGRSERLYITAGGSNSVSVEPLFVNGPLEELWMVICSWLFLVTWVETDGHIEGRGTLYLKERDLKKLSFNDLDKNVTLASVCEKIEEIVTPWLRQGLGKVGTAFGLQGRADLEVQVAKHFINGPYASEITCKDNRHAGWCSVNGLFLRDFDNELGQGTHKTVFGGSWISNEGNRDVAISMIVLSGDEGTKRETCHQIQREDLLAKEIDSPYVVGKAYDVFLSEDGERLFMASKKYFGTGHREELETKLGRPLTWKERVRIALDVAKGIRDIHAKGYIHRDIKDENVFIEYDPVTKEISAVVGDLGFVTEEHCQKDLAGTFVFMPPEVRAQRRWSKEGDLYSFGAYLCGLLSPSGTEQFVNVQEDTTKDIWKKKPNAFWTPEDYRQEQANTLMKALLGTADTRPSVGAVIATLENML